MRIFRREYFSEAKSDVRQNHVFNFFSALYRDRLTTPTNVWACCVACDVVQHFSREELVATDEPEETDEKCTDVTGETNSVAIEIAAEEEEITETKEDIQNIA